MSSVFPLNMNNQLQQNHFSHASDTATSILEVDFFYNAEKDGKGNKIQTNNWNSHVQFVFNNTPFLENMHQERDRYKKKFTRCVILQKDIDEKQDLIARKFDIDEGLQRNLEESEKLLPDFNMIL